MQYRSRALVILATPAARRNMMNPGWPERIVCGQRAEIHSKMVENRAVQTGLSIRFLARGRADVSAGGHGPYRHAR